MRWAGQKKKQAGNSRKTRAKSEPHNGPGPSVARTRESAPGARRGVGGSHGGTGPHTSCSICAATFKPPFFPSKSIFAGSGSSKASIVSDMSSMGLCANRLSLYDLVPQGALVGEGAGEQGRGRGGGLAPLGGEARALCAYV